MLRSILVVVTFVYCANGIEFTFELADNAEECFYQKVDQSVTATIQFQVVTGGKYDVDAFLEDPGNKLIYRRVKYEKDEYSYAAPSSGVYKLCFSNEFSTFSHKLVWLRIQVSAEDDLRHNPLAVVGSMETVAQEIHSRLVNVTSCQTHHRLVEAQTRKRAEVLNEAVLWWSLLETLTVVVVTVGEVVVLRNLFKMKE